MPIRPLYTFVSFLGLLILTFNIQAAEILNGHYDDKTDEVVLDLRYGGGCGTHEFSLEFDEFCLESYPMQQGAKLVHVADDHCRSILYKTHRIKLGVHPQICRPSYLTIHGDHESRVTIFLPKNIKYYQGQLMRVSGIGGESTGIGLKLYENGELYELVMDEEMKNSIVNLYGKSIEVKGRLTYLSGVETKDRPAIVVEELFVLE